MRLANSSAIIRELEDRIRHAEANERDHKNDPAIVRRELAGYTRGLKDALFVVAGEQKRGPSNG